VALKELKALLSARTAPAALIFHAVAGHGHDAQTNPRALAPRKALRCWR
jgi:hypothetical protein